MTVNIGIDANIDRIRLAEQGSAPSTPSTGFGYLYIKTDGLYFKGDGGVEVGPLAAASGGITQAYVGTNSVGGSWETLTSRRWYAKKITVANACWLTSVDAYIDAGGASDQINSLNTAVYADNSGTPSSLLGYSYKPSSSLILDSASGAGGNTTARWFQTPLMTYVTAGDYWVALEASIGAASSVATRLAYDAGGSDRYYTSGGEWVTDWGFYSPTTSSNNYSIRVNTLR